MAAYASLTSLMHIIDQIQHHPCPPISLDKQQVESLIELITFLQEFLEGYSHFDYSNESDPLESRIVDAAHAAEDMIESYVVNIIQPDNHDETTSSIKFYQDLHEVIEGMDLIKKEAMEGYDQLRRNSTPAGSLRASSSSSSSSTSKEQNYKMVGLDDALLDVMDKLIGGQRDRQIIPIVGMGGIGKTTLANEIYLNQTIVQHFDILTWVTVSQEYSLREILLELSQKGRGNLIEMNEMDLGNDLYKTLYGRRYLIVIDDIWDIQVWDKLKFFFPNNNNGSRIMLTTRLSKLASQLTHEDSCVIKINLLDDDKSWNLLCNSIFGKQDCPTKLVETGKQIAKSCKGLPLSIVVIGGLLAKSQKTQEYWAYILENLSSIVTLEDDERCLKILHTSYRHLPVYLKPCFLYLGIFKEDSIIRATELIELWVAEGLVKFTFGNSLDEETAQVYLEELIDRNLILLRKRNPYGKMKSFKIHDLVRELCLREARKQNFLCVVNAESLDVLQDIVRAHCVCVHKTKEYSAQTLSLLESASLTRSLHLMRDFQAAIPPFRFRLLRVSSMVVGWEKRELESKVLETVFEQVNLRYIALGASFRFSQIPSSLSHLWNLQTLVMEGNRGVFAPVEIWKMSQLRHVRVVFLELLSPARGYADDVVLVKLQTLLIMVDFEFDEEVVKRIPNIKKLGLLYTDPDQASFWCLKNLSNLHKLESLRFVCTFELPRLVQDLSFPHSLKKLTLCGAGFRWGDLTAKIGSLPLLQVLKLCVRACVGAFWGTVEGQFCNLKYLLVEGSDLECWRMESSHFPLLEHIVFRELWLLKKIPLSVGDIPTLEKIELDLCSYSAVCSAKRIHRKQKGLGNVDLHVLIDGDDQYKEDEDGDEGGAEEDDDYDDGDEEEEEENEEDEEEDADDDEDEYEDKQEEEGSEENEEEDEGGNEEEGDSDDEEED